MIPFIQKSLLITVLLIPACFAETDSLSSFTTTDGRVRQALFVQMRDDTITLRTPAADGEFITRKTNKEVFSSVRLFDGTELDLALSHWPMNESDEWEELFSAPSTGSLRIESNDVEAAIFFENTLAGITPLTIDKITEGIYPLQAEAQGYDPVEQKVTVTAGDTLHLYLTFTRSQAWKDSVSAYEDSVSLARARHVEDSINALAAKRIAAAVDEAGDNDSEEKIVDALVKGLAPDESSPMVLAVLPFTVSGELDSSAAVALSEYTVYRLSLVPGLSVVERSNFGKMMEEVALSQSGIVPEDKALEAGKVLAARYLVMGTVAEDGGRRLVTIRVIETQSGELVTASAGYMRTRQIDALSRELLREQMSPASTVFRSTLIPGWGQNYGGHRIRGAVYTVSAAGAIGALTWSALDYREKQSELDRLEKNSFNPQSGEDPEEYQRRLKRLFGTAVNERDRAADRTNLAIIGTAGLWVINIVDAAILGVSNSKSARTLYFTALPGREVNMQLGLKVNF